MSYLRNKINEEENDTSENVVKILFPCDQTNFLNELYFFKIQENGKLPILYLLKLTSTDISGIKITRNDTIYLVQKDYDKLKKKLFKIYSINDIYCTDPINPYLIEFNQKSSLRQHILTAYCVDKKSGQVLKTYYWLLRLVSSYTNLNCSRELKNQVPKSY